MIPYTGISPTSKGVAMPLRLIQHWSSILDSHTRLFAFFRGLLVGLLLLVLRRVRHAPDPEPVRVALVAVPLEGILGSGWNALHHRC